jgi:hypothetical protein
MNLPFLAFVINPAVPNTGEDLWLAELTPDGKLAGTSFTGLTLAENKLKLNNDQVALVAYDNTNSEFKFSVISTWTVRPRWLVRFPFFAFKFFTDRVIRKAWRQNEISKVLEALWKAYENEKDPAPIRGQGLQGG